MGTRATYTFTDANGSYNVYKHWDNYPSGAAGFIEAAMTKAWELPRFEADEFACSFITANKKEGGDLRLLPSGEAKEVSPSDIEYRYEIFQAKNGQLIIRAFSTKYWDEREETQIFYGRFKDFVAKFAEPESEPVTVKVTPVAQKPLSKRLTNLKNDIETLRTLGFLI